MAGGVLKATAQIIISVFADWSLNAESAKRYGAIKDRLRIGYIDVQMDFSRPMLSAAATQHDDAVVDAKLPMHEGAVRPIKAANQCGVKHGR